jgi:hypothetical protein
VYYILRRFYMDIKETLGRIFERKTVSGVARRAKVSRNTVYSVLKDPDKSSLRVLKQIFSALGYKLVLSLERKPEERQVSNALKQAVKRRVMGE